MARERKSTSHIPFRYVGKVKAKWTPAFHKIFVDICLEQTLEGNKPGTFFNKEGWMNIQDSFHRKTGLRYERKQLKNHWDITKEQWKVWHKLTTTKSMKWDSSTKTFGASEEDWDNYIKVNHDAAQFRYKVLPLSDKLDIIFNGRVDNGGTESPAHHRDLEDDSTIFLEHTKDPEEMDDSDSRSDHSNDAVEAKSIVIAQSSMDELNFSIEEGFECHDGMERIEQGSEVAHDQMSPGISDLKYRKVKATWTPAFHKIFVDLCLEQTLKGNKPETFMTNEGWENIEESFHKITGLRYERKQMKNHWSVTKEQWRVWHRLMGADSMKWDPMAQTFGASEEDWAKYIQAKPEAAQFRLKNLPFADKLDIIFDGTVGSGETERPAQRRRLHDGWGARIFYRKQMGDAKPDCRYDHHNDAVESRNMVAAQPLPGKLNYSIGECIMCLDGMEEIEQGSELYLFALDIFLKKEYREIFLQLKKSSVRMAWLQRMQSVGLPLLLR
ncbi:hypothetical protein NMG60_11011887 [Bertholletia excelsa]